MKVTASDPGFRQGNKFWGWNIVEVVKWSHVSKVIQPETEVCDLIALTNFITISFLLLCDHILSPFYTRGTILN